MSQFYVGPFVRVRVPMVKQPENIPWCPKCDKQRGDVNFCTDCGTELTMRQNWSDQPSPHWTIPATCVLRYCVTDGGLLHDDHVSYIYTIGNGRTDFNEIQPDEKKLKSFWRGSWYDRGAHDFQEVVPAEEIAWMRARCKDEIESICRVFGETNVSFGWGAVTGWR